jgi:hypothetical protein
MNPKVLLAAPTSRHKDYCFDAWVKNVKSLTYPVDVLIVDNTPDKGNYAYRKIVKYFPVMHVEPDMNEDSFNLITRCQNIIRNYFLGNGYDYLFMLESDHFPPCNVVEYLLSKNKKVVSLPYFIGQSFMSKVLQFDNEDFGTERLSRVMDIDKTFLNWNGKLKPKYQTGLGCTLISRDVLQRIKFRIPENNSEKCHADVFFHEDLAKLGIQNFVSEIAFSHHQNTGWSKILK